MIERVFSERETRAMFHPRVASHRASDRDMDEPTPIMAMVRFSLSVMLIVTRVARIEQCRSRSILQSRKRWNVKKMAPSLPATYMSSRKVMVNVDGDYLFNL